MDQDTPKAMWTQPEVRELTSTDSRADGPDVSVANGVTSIDV